MFKGVGRDHAFQIWLSLAILAACAVPTIWLISSEHQARVDRLRADGLVTMATVSDIREVEQEYTSRRGMRRTRMIDYIDLRYNMFASMPYRDFVSSHEVIRHKGLVGLTTYSRISSNAEVARLHVGDKVPVVIDPHETQRAELAEFVRDFDTRDSQLFMAGCLVFSLVAAWMARRRWRKLLAMG